MENKFTTSLVGLNALICGSTSGIGEAIAIEFSRLKANVTLFSRDIKKLQKTIDLLGKEGDQKHQYIVGDFDYPEKIKQLIQDHINQGNNYQILINNSGGPKGGQIIEAKETEFINAFKRHLICNHILSQAVLPEMENNNFGRIINIISTSVKEPIQGLGVSNTIRGAVASWAKTLSFELGDKKVTVNNILPGFTNTSRLSSIIDSRASQQNCSFEEIANNMKNQVPCNRFASPEEIAKAVAFIASPAASYINGVSLAVDGGRLNSI